MDKTENNTITGYHIDDKHINTDKIYKWHIPKKMRKVDIQPMDIVKVVTKKGISNVIVIESFRENIEDTGISYSAVIGIVNARGRKINGLKKEVEKWRVK